MHRPYKRTRALFLPFVLCAAPALAGPVDDLQPGHWYEAPSSKLDSVAANLPGTTAVINAWNGGAYDTVNDRLIVWGGGHSDYSGNEIYVFDLATLQWIRWNEPSANTSCNFSVNEYPDGAPCAMHTYEYVDFHPGSESFVILGGASPYPQGGGGAPTAHMYSFNSNAWRRGADRTGGSTLQGASSAYDPNRDVFWVLGSYDQKFAKFDPDANGGSGAWTQYSNVNIEIDGASAIDPVHDLFVTVDGKGTHRVRVHELANPSAAPISVTTSGDKTPEQQGQIGFEWDPVSEKLVAWFGGTSVYTLTPPASSWKTSTWVWDVVAAAPSNTVTPTAENSNGTYSRWRYVPAKNVFIVVNRTSDNVFFYKLSEGGGTPPPGDAESDWIARSTAPGVVYANDFRTQAEFDVGVFPDSRVANVTWDTRNSITGGHSARFDILKTDSENSGNWRTYLQPSGTAFADGDEFYVQYRLYIPAYHRGHTYLGGGGWKTSILSEHYASFTNHEVVLGNNGYRGYPRGYYRGRPSLSQGVDYILWDKQMGYLGCGATDPDYVHQPEIDRGPQSGGTTCENNRRRYGGLYSYGNPAYGESALPDPITGAEVWRADQWQTVLQHVRIGSFDQANSTVETWFAADGQPYTLLYRKTDAILGALDAGENGYEAIWLTPFDTGKDPDPTRQDTFINYDQLIVSTQFIDAPGVSGGGGPGVQISANPTTVVSGGSTTLTWSSTDTTSCTASGSWSGAKALSGTQVMSNLLANKTYVLSCSGTGGTSEDSASVTVTPPAPTVTLNAAPTSVAYNGSSTLSWSSTNATSCTASGDWSGSKATSGSQVMSSLTANKHYVLTCTGAGGSGNDSADVTVGPPPPVVDLTANPDSVDFGDSTTLVWSSTQADLCVASGAWSGARATTGQEVIPALEADSSFSLTCIGAGGRITDTATVDVGAAPPQQPVVVLTANPSAVDYLGQTTLTWSSTNATSCVASGSWSGARALSGSEVRGPLSSDSVFTLSCTGLGGTAARSISVDVALPPEPPTLAFSVNPAAVPHAGSANLSWSSTHADGCVASGGWGGARPPSGTASTGALTVDTVFNLSCTGSGGTVAKSVSVDVQPDPLPAPQVTFTATPPSIDYGATTVLSWTADYAVWCTASGAWSGVKAPAGSEATARLTANSTFMLSCFNESGRTNETISVVVAAPGDLRPIVSFFADATWVDYHGTPTLTWSATNAATCVASGSWAGVRPLAGSELLEPLEQSGAYTLRCSSEAGEAEAVVAIAVGPPDGDAWLELSASPSQVDYRGDVQLAWTAANVDSCVASGGWSGERPSSGSELVAGLIGDSHFMLSCSGAAGTVSRSVPVSVGEPGAPTLKLTAEPNSVAYGGTSVLTWTGEHLDVCVASGDWAGERAPDGIESVGPLGDTSEYTLECSGPGGSISAAEHVEVSQPSADDTDGDGLSDEWEQLYFGDLSRDGSADADDDGLSDGDEYDERTDPTRVDTDGDGAGDSEELFYGSDPRDSGDVWTTHRPQRPDVDDSQTLELRGGVIATTAPYADPDGNALAYSQWQLGADDSFYALALDRAVLGSVTLEVPAGVLEKATPYWARTRHVDTTGQPSEWSEAKELMTAEAFPNDADGDDIDDDYQVDGFADTNTDGVDDDTQGLCNLYDAEGRSVIGFGASAGRIRCFTSIGNSELPDGALYEDELQYGMFAFSIEDLPVDVDNPATVQVTIYLPEAPTPLSGCFKFDEANGEVTDFSAYSTISGTSMRLNLVDGGAGDEDGVVNGVIVDPSGPAIARSAPPPPPSDGGGGGGGPPDPPSGGDGGGGGGAVDPLALLLLWRSLLRKRRSGLSARE